MDWEVLCRRDCGDRWSGACVGIPGCLSADRCSLWGAAPSRRGENPDVKVCQRCAGLCLEMMSHPEVKEFLRRHHFPEPLPSTSSIWWSDQHSQVEVHGRSGGACAVWRCHLCIPMATARLLVLWVTSSLYTKILVFLENILVSSGLSCTRLEGSTTLCCTTKPLKASWCFLSAAHVLRITTNRRIVSTAKRPEHSQESGTRKTLTSLSSWVTEQVRLQRCGTLKARAEVLFHDTSRHSWRESRTDQEDVKEHIRELHEKQGILLNAADIGVNLNNPWEVVWEVKSPLLRECKNTDYIMKMILENEERCSSRGEFIPHGAPVKGSHMIDLLKHLKQRSRKSQPPTDGKHFIYSDG